MAHYHCYRNGFHHTNAFPKSGNPLTLMARDGNMYPSLREKHVQPCHLEGETSDHCYSDPPRNALIVFLCLWVTWVDLGLTWVDLDLTWVDLDLV